MRARSGIEVVKYKGAWPDEAIHVLFLWEPGSIMQVTGSCPEQKSSNYPHQSKMKGFNNQWGKSQLTHA